MSYIRKFVAFILSIIFCVALIIGLGVILSVRNVNVEFIKSSPEGSDEKIIAEYETTLSNFEKIKGSNLLFLSDDDISNYVSNKDYLFILSYEKVFPCSVNIKLKERVELFSYKTDEGFNIYDETGTFLRKSKTNTNSLDASPNVLVDADLSQMPFIGTSCTYFKNSFSSIRNLVESIKVEESLLDNTNTLTFNFYSGIKIVVADCKNSIEEKIKMAYSEYSSLSEKDKTCGVIRVVASGEDKSTVQAVYMR